MLEVGKLYVCEEYYLLLYPDPLTAARADFIGGDKTGDPVYQSSYWSMKLRKPVSYAKNNTPFLVLNKDKNEWNEEYTEVLAGDRKGWIIYSQLFNIKEIE